MKIVNIIPISRGILNEELSYFSAENVTIGSTVIAPFGNKKIIGLVVSVENAVAIKSRIRKSDFTLKKIIQIKNSGFLLPEFVRAAEKISDYSASLKSLVLSSLIPKVVIENLSDFKLKSAAGPPKISGLQFLKPKIIQAPDDERFSTSKRLIRENFAQAKSVIIIAPTGPELENVFAELSRGIERNSFLLAGRTGPKKILKLWQEIISRKRPVLIASLPISLSLPRADLGTIILEGESNFYKQLSRPYLDLRRFADFLAKEIGAQLILADSILSLETIKKFQDGLYQELPPVRGRVITAAKSQLIDMGPQDKLKTQDKFPIFSPEVKKLVLTTKDNGSRMLMIINRRGLHPTTVCRDCGDILFCNRCASPLVVHQAAGKRIFACHKCQDIQDSIIRCRKCGGWNLKTFGLGIELVVKELSDFYPAKRIFRLDSETIKSPETAKKLVGAFTKTPGGLMVATEMALFYLKEPVETVAVISLDNLFTIPDFNIGEKVFRILIKLKLLATKEFLVQTRHPDQPSLKEGLKGNIMEFARQESEERKKFDYPPFSMLIKISRQGKENVVVADLKELTEKVKKYHPIIIPAFTARIKNAYRAHIVLRVDPLNWPEPKLVGLLKSLPPKFMVEVEPENLL